MTLQMKANEQCFPVAPFDHDTAQDGNPNGLYLKQANRNILEVCTNLEGIVSIPDNMIIRETGD